MEGQQIRDALMEYKTGVGELAKHFPDIAETYNRFTDACFEEGELCRKTKHLIGVALGVLTGDEYCILYHCKGAVDQGATDRQVLEAACVSAAFGGGMAMSQIVTLVQESLDAFRTAH
ncbi:carboxymuconolactone decarboxylase family protein [Staphylospora marina]|uniref:carboxymuconolactone decarboxylase family protein n=1 Tax=Staphylospora marina TaxID=2490858 RepID=UPI000F5C14F7|nr:carboxymuconolactone decarboxylase family protein [Staphylospora marina]